MKNPEIPPSKEAMFRYLVVSQVRTRRLMGMTRNAAIEEVSAQEHLAVDGRWRRLGRRTIYRWVEELEKAEEAQTDVLEALARKARNKTTSSVVLEQDLLDYLAEEKKADPGASIPELINRAREQGHLSAGKKVCRSTVHRALKRMGISLSRRRGAASRDCRRYSFAHRLECVLCDGKHFRAGVKRAKRVALFFLDDATRFALHVVVGTSENRQLFLRGLYEMVRRYGLMSILFLDHGAGFVAGDTVVVAKKLGAALIHGEKAYPEGHGKVEAFNKSAKARVLRGYDGRPDVDPACSALEFRLQHYCREAYNHTPHESLDGQTPAERFLNDPKPLRTVADDAALRDRFSVSLTRSVSKDNVISFKGTAYELPTGYASQSVDLVRRVLEGTLHFLHDGRYLQLLPVDPQANAHRRRAHRERPCEEPQSMPRKSAADMAFERNFQPLIGPDGGYSES
jgi:transposase InsO family protein